MTKKALTIILLILVAIIGSFFYFLSNPPTKLKALRSLKQLESAEEVKNLWDTYRGTLADQDDFVLAIKKKLISFNLSRSELTDCRTWLPEPPSNLNLIIVPDLSDRISDSENNPNQTERDRTILRAIWKSFVAHTKLKSNSKDHIMITITDRQQANWQFGEIADDLICDLSTNEKGVNRLFFTPYRQSKFYKNIDHLYHLAEPHPTEVDFFNFFEVRLPTLLKTSDLFNAYTNKIIILTDGYLESNSRLTPKRTQQWLANNQRPFNEKKLQNQINAALQKQAKINHQYSTVAVLVCEINAQVNSSIHEQTALTNYWQFWLKTMGIQSPVILSRGYAVSETNKAIDTFIGDH